MHSPVLVYHVDFCHKHPFTASGGQAGASLAVTGSITDQ